MIIIRSMVFYSEAYDYRNDSSSIETMMAWICSCHNLSILYAKRGKLTLALIFLTVPHNYLQSVSESEKANDEIKPLAYKGLSITFSLY